MKFVAERTLHGWITTDNGMSRVATLDLENEGDDIGLYIDLRSFDPERRHLSWEELKHKRVRITVETID